MGTARARHVSHRIAPDSWASQWVQDELSLALGQRKQIIGVLCKPTLVSGFLTNYQMLDATRMEARQAAQVVVAALTKPSSAVSPSEPSRRASLPPARRASIDVSGEWQNALGTPPPPMAFKPVKAPTARAFPTSSILTLTAGVLEVMAFFGLPLITIPQITNITISLYYVLTLPSESGMIRDYLEPLGAVMLVLFGLLAPKLGKRANLVSLLGALLVFTFVVWSFVTIPSTLTGGAQLGLGFWTMIVAGILGLAGAIMGLRGR